MIVVASSNGHVGIENAVQVLRDGGSALDAVEVGVRWVEANAEDHSVGYGGYPNILGEVELDAGIMDGDTLETGAVGALQGYTHAISVARQVMETLPHVFLVGEGAARFAEEMEAEARPLLTEAARKIWAERLAEDLTARLGEEVDDFAACESLIAQQPDLWRWVEMAMDPERAKGTTNFIAQDAQGHIAVGVSTSGWAWKYPGRLGDSPVIGAGLYADDRYGAAACTGMGEMAIRANTAHSVVFYMKMGFTLEDAGRRALADLNDLGGRYLSRMNFIALDRDGHPLGFSNAEDQSYIFMTPEMSEPETQPRVYVSTVQRWQALK